MIALVVDLAVARIVFGGDILIVGNEISFWETHSAIEATCESLRREDEATTGLSVRPSRILAGTIEMELGKVIELKIAKGSAISHRAIPRPGETAVILIENSGRIIPFHLLLGFMPNRVAIFRYGVDEMPDADQLKLKLKDLAAEALRKSAVEAGSRNVNRSATDLRKSGVAHHSLLPMAVQAIPHSLNSSSQFELVKRQATDSASVKTGSGDTVPAATPDKVRPISGEVRYSASSPSSLGCSHCKNVDQILATFEPANQVEHLFLPFSDVTAVGLRELHRFTKLTWLGLGNTNTGDDGLRAVVENTDLTVLHLSQTKITDKGVRLLVTERHLQRLSLSETKFTDSGLTGLKGLPELIELNLFRCGISDAGIKTLVTIPQLKTLYLGERKVTGNGIEQLAECRKLEFLSLQESGITDEGLRGIVAIRSLKTLDLIKTGVTDIGLENLTDHPKLEVVFLNDTEVTAAGVQHFLRSQSLKRINVSNTRLNRDSVDKLRHSYPLLEIEAHFVPERPKKQ